jgi:hypothetical protein
MSEPATRQYLWSPADGGEPVLISRGDVDELHRVAQLLDKHLPGWVHEYSTPLPGLARDPSRGTPVAGGPRR